MVLGPRLRRFSSGLLVAGRARALEMVRLAAQDGEDSATCTLLLDVAKLAMQANHKVSKGEVAALRSLCAALGVNPREHLPED